MLGVAAHQLGARGMAEPALEHVAAVQGDPGGLGDGGDRPRAQRTAVLHDLDAEQIGGARLDHAERIGGREHALIRHHGGVERGAHRRQRRDLIRGDRLLDEGLGGRPRRPSAS